ncbi:MAG: prepilin-type N-terminal cleavage/methylation domain-containing protein [Planctomycetes bacterium]|nr:prepilin-type N-terminal cleavage/methylation domain-containing protein [Planctomycetota bacterium]
MRKRTNGMTLVEIAVALAVLAILAAAILIVFSSFTRDTNNVTRANDLAARGRITLDQIRSELQFARFTAMPDGGVNADHTVIRYQRPIATLPNGQQVYGVLLNNPDIPVPNGFYELAFVGDLILRETAGPTPPASAQVPAGIETLTVDWDLNGDGDLGDTVIRGRLTRHAYDAAGIPLAGGTAGLDDYLALRVRPDDLSCLDGALEHDGTPGAPPNFLPLDPLFLITDENDIEVANTSISTAARKVRVTLWHVNFDYRERALLRRRNQQFVKLDNPQS